MCFHIPGLPIQKPGTLVQKPGLPIQIDIKKRQ